jgi:hypothetical protein
MLCGGHACHGNPTSCRAHLQVYERLTNLWTSILCEKDEFQMWHRQDCLMGNCTNCGVSFLKVCAQEMTSEMLIKWKNISYKMVGTTDDENPRKASTLQYRETPAYEFFHYLWPKLESFVLHNYVASWQDFQFKELFNSVFPQTLISCGLF